jgi:short-subunit dehydrogenase
VGKTVSERSPETICITLVHKERYLINQKVLITGCSTGIGRALAQELTQRTYHVIATARNVATLTALDVAQRVQLDVTNDHSVRHAREVVGDIDVLVDNAGVGIEGPIESVGLEQVRQVFETHFFGVARTIQAFVPAMRERGFGTVANVSLGAGRIALPLQGYYATSKWALEALSEALWFEVAHWNIRVRVVEVGPTQTPFRSKMEEASVANHVYQPLFDLMVHK